jgi:hypothetical protein
MKNLEEYLEKEGPKISQDLLTNWGKSTQSQEAKRKSLERAIRSDSRIAKLSGVWSNNSSFVYLNSQYKTPAFYEVITDCFRIYSSTCYSVYKAIELHGGRMSKMELRAYCCSPVENLKGHKKLEVYLEFLVSIGYIFDNDDFFDLNPSVCKVDSSKVYAIGLAKKILMANFDDWASKNNFQAWNSTETFGEFAKFAWGHKSPSYIPGIRRSFDSPGFIVADFLVGETMYYKSDIDFFIKKVDILNSIPGFPSFMPFFICDSKLDSRSFDELKKRGIVACSTKSLFGKNYADALKSIYDTICSISVSVSSFPEELVELLKKIEKLIDGKTNNLRGDLFELIVALYFTQDHNGVIINNLVLFNGKKREIDVTAETSSEIFFSECKAYKNPIKLEIVKNWIEEKVPTIKEWYKDKQSGSAKKMHFEFWSGSGFEEEALKYLTDQKINNKKVTIDFFDKSQILKKAYDIKFLKFKEYFQQYFDV